jgi:hypothetical protein
MAHGIDMNHIHASGITREVEQDWVRRVGPLLKGWYSPAYSETRDTLDLVAAEGCEYVCD